MTGDTIVALSTGQLPSGVAIIRVSGSNAQFVMEAITNTDDTPDARKARLCNFRYPASGEILDQGLLFWFPSPASFTGEDCVEFHVHGSKAVVSDLLSAVCELPHCRLAEAGEFTRRAFDNGKIDLTQAEGLADLLLAETSTQRKLALDSSSGKLRKKAEDWRTKLIRMRAYLEADIDFVEEDDIPDHLVQAIQTPLRQLLQELEDALENFKAGELIRDGFRIALVGVPNSGKSSLLNAFAKRDVAIVSDIPGTTRDLIEVKLNIGGKLVVMVDTAGIRETSDLIEMEGVRRSRDAINLADLVIELVPVGLSSTINIQDVTDHVFVRSKDDKDIYDGASVSVRRDNGLEALEKLIKDRLEVKISSIENLILVRERHRHLVSETANCLRQVLNALDSDVSVAGEAFRSASHSIGKLTGQIEVDELLAVVFSEFCVGK